MHSGLAVARPSNIIVLPVLFEGQVKAVIELASLGEFTPSHLAFLEQLTGSIGVVLNTIEATMRTEGLLLQSQQLAGELQTQQKELQQTNDELATKARLLAEQNVEVERKNKEIEFARRAVEEKAAELALTSRYKSEFLANMSHELRTPLNSILVLGQQLAENADGNLTERQTEFARTIHGAGTDLLNLISDILDLSKIESGTVTVESEEIPFAHLRDTIERTFRHDAEARELAFTTEFAPNLGRAITTDPKRLLQVVKNLLSNALKFTTKGEVRLRVGIATGGWSADHPILSKAQSVVEFEVTRHGHRHPRGEAEDHLRGLPAGRCRHGAQVRRHRPRARDQPRAGPAARRRNPPAERAGPRQHVHAVPAAQLRGAGGNARWREAGGRRALAPHQQVVLSTPRVEQVPDDRGEIRAGDAVLLIVEDDAHYARVLLGLARDHGFKCVVARTGADALLLARKYTPMAISLDVFLPDMLGWTVLSELKRDPTTRHIPVQIVSVEEERQYGLERGAFSFHNKPLTTDALKDAFDRLKCFAEPRVRELLVVEDDPREQMSVVELLGHDDIRITTADTGAEALSLLRSRPFDCVVLDLKLPDMSGFDLLAQVQDEESLRDTPIVVFTGRELTAEEEAELRRKAKSIVVKGVRSPERLLDETALFLHRVVKKLPPAKQRMLEGLHDTDEALLGRKALVVDDDVRNIFALSSLLERRGMTVASATTGEEAIKQIETQPDLQIVLMDIMMPEMDGYETIQRIRKDDRYRRLPIIALTAKAMKGDREKCLEAGASDYIAKPVNTKELLALVRMWLHR